MSSKNTNKQSLKKLYQKYSYAYIAKLKMLTAKITEINNLAKQRYQVQPLLIIIPFAAGLLAAGIFADFSNGSSNSQNDNIAVASLSSTSHSSSNNSSPKDELLVAQADEKEQAQPKKTEKPKIQDVTLPEEMKMAMSPEEVKIFELFTKLAEIQESKGEESPEAQAIGQELETLIDKVKVQKEQEKATAAPVTTKPDTTKKTVEKPATSKPAAQPKPTITPKINGKINPTSKIIEEAKDKAKTTETAKPDPARAIRATSVRKPVTTTNKTTEAPKTTAKPVAAITNNKDKAVDSQPDKANDAAETAEAEVLPDDELRITTETDVIDLKELLAIVGKRLELNFWFEDGNIPTSSILLHQYGEIPNEELLPLLTSVLAKCSTPYMMVKEGPYTKIMKMTEVQKNTDIFTPDLGNEYQTKNDTIVATVVKLENIDYTTTLKPILDKFIPSSEIITEIPNTNKIVIADYSKNLKRITDIIKMVDVAGPSKKLEIIVPTYLKPEDTKSILEDMYNKLYGEDGIAPDNSVDEPDTPDNNDPGRFDNMSPAERARAIAAERRQQISNNARNRNNRQQPGTQQNNNSIAPSITVDKRTGRLFIIGSEKELSNIKHILSLFDVPKGGQQVELKIYSPTYLDSQSAVEKIQKLMKAINEEQAEQEQADSPDPEPTQPTTNRQPARRTVPGRTTTQQTADDQVDGMFMLVDDRTNRIIILGWKEQIEQFEELLTLFDVPLPGGEITLQIIKLANTEAADTLGKVKELLSAINEQSTGKAPSENSVTGRTQRIRPNTRPGTNNNNQPTTDNSSFEDDDSGPFMLADERLNRILIVGVQEQIDQAKELVDIIDQEWPDSEVKLKIFTFDVVEVEAITEQITELIEAMSDNLEEGQTRNTADRDRSSDIFNTGSRQTNRNNIRNGNNDSSPSLQQIGEEGPFLMPDNRLNRLFVIGMDDQIQKVADMIAILDKSIGLELQIVPQFQYILSSEAADQISKLLAVLHEQEQPQSGGSSRSNRYNNNTNNRNRNTFDSLDDRDNNNRSTTNRNTNSGYNRRDGLSSIIEVSPRGPFLLPDDRTNRLLVVSTNNQYDEIINLLPIIDVPPSKHDNMTLEIHQLKYVPVNDVIDILDSLELTQNAENLDEKYNRYGPGTNRSLTGRQTVDSMSGQNVIIQDWSSWTNIEEPMLYVAKHEPTNRLFIYATLYQHEEISEMIKVIDVEPDDTLGQVKVFKMRNQEPAVIREALEKLYVEPLTNQLSEQGAGNDAGTRLQGLEMPPTVHELPDIFSVAVRGSKRQLDEVKDIIEDIDIPMPQVLIEASLIKITLNESFKLGVTLQDVFKLPDGRSISGQSPFADVSLNSDGFATSGGSGNIAYFNEGFVYAALEALNANTNSEISSMPRVLTLDNKEATIESYNSRPIQQPVLSGNSSEIVSTQTDWIEAGTSLTIIPHIGVFDDDPNNKKAFLRLEITLDVDNFIGEGEDTATTNNSIKSHVNIPNGAYIILGGLTQTDWSDVETKIPVLGDIPLIGSLFRNISKSKGRTVLYVFVKAEIVSDKNFEQLKKLSKINEDKMRDLQENFDEMPAIPGFKSEKRERINQNETYDLKIDKTTDKTETETEVQETK